MRTEGVTMADVARIHRAARLVERAREIHTSNDPWEDLDTFRAHFDELARIVEDLAGLVVELAASR